MMFSSPAGAQEEPLRRAWMLYQQATYPTDEALGKIVLHLDKSEDALFRTVVADLLRRRLSSSYLDARTQLLIREEHQALMTILPRIDSVRVGAWQGQGEFFARRLRLLSHNGDSYLLELLFRGDRQKLIALDWQKGED